MGGRDDIDKLIGAYRQEIDDDDEDDDVGPTGERKPFVDRSWFNVLVSIIIMGNAATIGLETDARSQAKGGNVQPFWYMLELVFCTLFMIELGLRLFFHGLTYFWHPLPSPRPADRDAGELPPTVCSRVKTWIKTLPYRLKYSNLVDFFIVVSSLTDTFILVPLGSGGGARFVSMLRFVRLMRLIRLVRLFKIFKELWLVASGLINAMKTLVWVCLMIFVVCYIGGIFTTMWIGHNDKVYDSYFRKSGWDHEIYFSTVTRSVFTLFQIITLDEWSDSIARHVIKNQPHMAVFFLALVCIVTFGLLNIIVGVVVENVLSTAARDERKIKKAKDKDRQLVFNQLREIFEDADADGSGSLTFEEVESAISKPEIFNKLRMIEFPVEEPQQIFKLLDYDDSGELTIEEFITGCLRMKGNAKSKDMLVAQVALDCMKKHYVQFEKEMQTLQHKLRRLDATARAITDHGERVFLDMQKYRLRHPDEKRGSLVGIDGAHSRVPWEEESNAIESPHAEVLALVEANDHEAIEYPQSQEMVPHGGTSRIVDAASNPGSPQNLALRNSADANNDWQVAVPGSMPG